MRGDINITSGCLLLTASRLEVLTASDAYVQTKVGLAFKERDVRIFLINRLFSPFRSLVWIIISILLLISIFVILMTRKLSQKWRHFYIGGRLNRSPILNMWHLMLGGSIQNRHIANGQNFSNFSRTLTFLWILLWFVLRCWYEGTLYFDLQRREVISSCDTVKKIETNNCMVYGKSRSPSLHKQWFKNVG